MVDPEKAKDFRDIGGNNDFYNSEIVTIGVEVMDNQKRKTHFDLVIKGPVQTTVHKLMARFFRPFMAETFFYVTAPKACPQVLTAVKMKKSYSLP